MALSVMFWVTKKRQRWPHTYTEGKQIVGPALTCCITTQNLSNPPVKVTESGKRNCGGREEVFLK